MIRIKSTMGLNLAARLLPSKAGSALIGMVVAILIFSVLAAAIVPIVGSSGQQAAISAMAARAYLLAESGFRYAASQYLHTGDLDEQKNDLLDALGGNYTLSGDSGQFNLSVESYFLTMANPSTGGPSQFKAHCPGTFPGDMTIANGLGLRIGDQDHTITAVTPIFGEEDDNVTISVTPALLFYPKDERVYPTVDAVSVETFTSGPQNGFNIVYENNDGRMFPMRNGRIRLESNGSYYTYRFNDRASNRLLDIRDPENPYVPISALPVSAGTKIVLMPHIRLNSTGIYGTDPMRVRRTVSYHAPLPLSVGGTEQTTITERFDSKQDWTDTTGTQTAIGDIDGNAALKVEASATAANDTGSLTLFTPQTTDAGDLFNANLRSSRGYLSYDTQVKIGFEPIPPVPFFPESPIPAYAAAGLNFRLNDPPPSGATIFNVNTYGISVLRSNDAIMDGIPDDLVPINDERSIVLWQQTGNGSTRNWIAFKSIATVFALPLDDFESGPAWNRIPNDATNLWNLSSRNARSGSQAWAYAYESSPGVFNYDTGLRNSGAVQSPAVALPADYPSATLTFWSWHVTEPFVPSKDVKQVRISVDGGPFEPLFTLTRDPDEAYWYQERIDLSEYAGSTIRLQFFFDTIDSLNNAYDGWAIDDVQIICQWPVQNATLGIRLQEAMVLPFIDGQPEIRQGDRIYGNSRLTTATVMAPPLVTSGDWVTTPAQGVLLLNRASVVTTGAAFDAAGNETLTVIGGTGRARVSPVYDDTNDRKANIIQAFYASETGGGSKTGNQTPLDNNFAPYPRRTAVDELRWFPEVDASGNWTDDDGNFTPTEDVFRLIEWDAVNDTAVAGLKELDFTTADQGLVRHAVIQSHHIELQSPDYPALVSPFELGLHTFGDGSDNVFFDDFGLRIEVAETDIIPTPLQE